MAGGWELGGRAAGPPEAPSVTSGSHERAKQKGGGGEARGARGGPGDSDAEPPAHARRPVSAPASATGAVFSQKTLGGRGGQS